MRTDRSWQPCWACVTRVYADEATCPACGAAPRRRLRTLDRRRVFRATLRAYQRAGFRVRAVRGYDATLAPPRPALLARLTRRLAARPRVVYLEVDACGWVRDSDGRTVPPHRAPRQPPARRPPRRWAPCRAQRDVAAPSAGARARDAGEAAP